MGLNLADFARSNQTNTAAAAGTERTRTEAKLWLNFGYLKSFTNEQGDAEQVFVTIARGIPVDQIEPFDLDKIRNTNMATLRRDQNKFLAAILSEAESLQPGQSKFICFDEQANLGIELRRVGEAAVPVAEEEDAAPAFSFRS